MAPYNVPDPSMLQIILILYGVMSIVTFGAYGIDKRRAILSARRTPEKTLHLLELCCGWPGAIVGQLVFHHKTRKLRYQFVFIVIVAAHVAAWLALWRWQS
ncbi:hypothetical protein BH10PLA1_BH10PLA1_20040 [soil metagenome]